MEILSLCSVNENDIAVIQKVLSRKSQFMRKAAGTNSVEQIVATNIDTVFICMSLNNDFNVRRLERYLYRDITGKVTTEDIEAEQICNEEEK